MEHRSALIEAYKRLAVEKGTLPVSRKEIASAAELDFVDFETTFSTLEALQEAVWVEYFRGTLETLEGSEEFAQYSVREKLLAYYYTLFEHLGMEEDFVKMFGSKLGIWNYSPTFLGAFRHAFQAFMNELVNEGIESGEIAERVVMGDEYADWHWPQMLFLLNKWVEDKSEKHANTDQAIEKAVNLGFDIMGRNVFDSAFDFAKFMIMGK
ncbi:MAG: TetR family transcriptional regulator C-terminal domain-containing protein [Bacteroidia bacterium]